jgi:hypothetical protein
MRNAKRFAAIDDQTLDAAAGGLSVFRLGMTTAPAAPIATLPHPTAIPVGGVPFGAAPLIGGAPTDLVQFSAQAAYSVNASHGTLPGVVGTTSLSNAANQLAHQTNGLVVFGGDLNHDGRIGAEDFVHVRGISDAQAASYVGSIMDRLHQVAGSAQTAAQTAAANQVTQGLQAANSLFSQLGKMFGQGGQGGQRGGASQQSRGGSPSQQSRGGAETDPSAARSGSQEMSQYGNQLGDSRVITEGPYNGPLTPGMQRPTGDVVRTVEENGMPVSNVPGITVGNAQSIPYLNMPGYSPTNGGFNVDPSLANIQTIGGMPILPNTFGNAGATPSFDGVPGTTLGNAQSIPYFNMPTTNGGFNVDPSLANVQTIGGMPILPNTFGNAGATPSFDGVPGTTFGNAQSIPYANMPAYSPTNGGFNVDPSVANLPTVGGIPVTTNLGGNGATFPDVPATQQPVDQYTYNAGDASAYDTTNQVAAAADYAVDTGAIS